MERNETFGYNKYTGVELMNSSLPVYRSYTAGNVVYSNGIYTSDFQKNLQANDTTHCDPVLLQKIRFLMVSVGAVCVDIIRGYEKGSVELPDDLNDELQDDYWHRRGRAADVRFIRLDGTTVPPGDIIQPAIDVGFSGVAVYGDTFNPANPDDRNYYDYIHLDTGDMWGTEQIRWSTPVIIDTTKGRSSIDINATDIGLLSTEVNYYVNINNLVNNAPNPDAQRDFLIQDSLGDNNYSITDELASGDVFVGPMMPEGAGAGGAGDTDLFDRSEAEQAGYSEYVEAYREYVTTLKGGLEHMFSGDTDIDNVKLVSKYFGAPFRFTKHTDPPAEYTDSSGNTFKEGRTYATNIGAECPVIHFIPGLPTFANDFTSSEKEILRDYINESYSGNGEVKESVMNKVMGIDGRYFNFVPAWSSYVRYVNLLCRQCAIYMGLGDAEAFDSGVVYKNVNYAKFQSVSGGIFEGEQSVFGSGDADIFEGVSDKYKNADITEAASETTEGSSNTTDTSNNTSNNTSIMDAFENIEFVDSEGNKNVFSRVMVGLENFLTNVVTDIFGGYDSVKCYVDPSASFSEGIRNSTTESKVASLFDTGQSLTKEIQMWSGNGITDFVTNVGSIVGSVVEGLAEMLGMENAAIGNAKGYMTEITKGYNLVFPEMWSDSEYSKSYSFTVKLHSPYGDKESIFLNIMVPLMFLIALGLPRQASGNSYASPFFVRCIAKGWFSCDMGIIDSIDIKRGGGDSWNIHGMPVECEVSINVKDLYSSLSMTSTDHPGLYFNNPTLIEFLSATCGVDLTKPNLSLKIASFASAFTDPIQDFIPNAYNSVMQKLNNTIMRISGMYRGY